LKVKSSLMYKGVEPFNNVTLTLGSVRRQGMIPGRADVIVCIKTFGEDACGAKSSLVSRKEHIFTYIKKNKHVMT